VLVKDCGMQDHIRGKTAPFRIVTVMILNRKAIVLKLPVALMTYVGLDREDLRSHRHI
jgi:hypothetical protein